MIFTQMTQPPESEGYEPDPAEVRGLQEALGTDLHLVPAQFVKHLLDAWEGGKRDGLTPAEIGGLLPAKGEDQPSPYARKMQADKYLNQFFEGRGARFPFLAKIAGAREAKKYHLVFQKRGGTGNPEPPNEFGALRTFWRDYLGMNTEVPPDPHIVITSPLFFRFTDVVRPRAYLRDLDVNDESERLRLNERLGLEVASRLEPSRHYYSAGEVRGAIALLNMFRDLGVRPLFDSAMPSEPVRAAANRSVVAIGSPRTNSYSQESQEGKHWVVVDGGVEEPSSDKAYMNVDRGAVTHHYAVLTRSPHPLHEAYLSVTTISASHGRASQGVADYITLNGDIGELNDALSASGGLPRTFQALFSVSVSRSGNESSIRRKKLEDVWVGK